MDGKIDMIITKSIPRFARNTLDTLRYVRLLREKNVAIYFEVEKINTLVDGEFLMTILSSVAQQEVENTSVISSLTRKYVLRSSSLTKQEPTTVSAGVLWKAVVPPVSFQLI